MAANFTNKIKHCSSIYSFFWANAEKAPGSHGKSATALFKNKQISFSINNYCFTNFCWAPLQVTM
jgi:hypothetical protein